MSSFSINLGHAAIPEDTNLWSLVVAAMTVMSKFFSLIDPSGVLSSSASLEQILQTIFPPCQLAFFSPQEHTDMPSCLQESERALLLAQAICAIIVVFARLEDSGKEICQGLLSKELQLLSEDDQLRILMNNLENCHVFGKCFMKTQLEDAMMDAITAARRHDTQLPDVNLGADAQHGIRMSEIPARNMGLPWGFTIMSIN